jgi:hypothetical protein
VYADKAAFDEAQENTLNPPRWVTNRATRGRRTPLPTHLMIDVNGAFIEPESLHVFVDDHKLDRPVDLFNKGYT